MGLINDIHRTGRHIRRRHTDHDDSTAILKATDLTVRYESGFALDHLSFELEAGTRTAVVGPNGAGKSTLFKVIAGVMNHYQGEVQVFGWDPGGHICIAYVPQRSQVDWSFPATVADVVMMGRVGKIGLFRHPTGRDWRVVHDALATVRLTDLAKRQLSELSGGQQQRMFIARALAQEAELVLMDEPLSGLDVNSQEDIFGVLNALHERGVTFLVALHDLKIAAERFDRVLLLNRRLVGYGTPAEVFTPENLLAAYGGHLQLIADGDLMVAVGDTCCDDGDVSHD